MAKKIPTRAEVRAKVLNVDAVRQKAVKQLTRDLKKLYGDYQARVIAALATKSTKSADLYALSDITAMMTDLHRILNEAGFEDVLNRFAGSFPELAHAATAYTEALGVDPSMAGVDTGTLHAYVEFQTTQLAQNINQKLVTPIQSALIHANFGSLARQVVIDQIAALQPSLSPAQATTLVDTAFAQFQRSVIVAKGDELNLEIYQYLGPDDDITSEQCKFMLDVDWHGAPGFLYKDEITIDLHENLRDNPLIAGGHPNCFLPGTKINGKILRASKARYSGEAVTIDTRKGHRLSVTPNHPILTARGFVPAAMLNPGDQVVSYNCDVEASVAATLTGESYKYDGPALVEDIFETILTQGSLTRVRPSILDLHGDAQPWNGDIDIVEMNRVLPLDSNPMLLKSDRENILGKVNLCCVPPVTEGSFDFGVSRVSAASAGFPSSSHLAPHQGRVGSDTSPLQPLTLGTGAFFDSVFTEYSLDSALSDAMLAFQLHDRFPTEILLDEIVEVRRGPFNGHVYDVESVTGWVIAHGVCASNCRHQWSPVTLAYAQEQGFEVDSADRGSDQGNQTDQEQASQEGA